MLRRRLPNLQQLTESNRIQNPLAGVSTELLLHQVNEFANSHGLNEVAPLLRKGALVARDPMNYEDISGSEKLNDAEVEALRNEVLHKWRQPFALYATIVICSIGAAVQGWDQTGMSLPGGRLAKPTRSSRPRLNSLLNV